jgi:hypothetical protein
MKSKKSKSYPIIEGYTIYEYNLSGVEMISFFTQNEHANSIPLLFPTRPEAENHLRLHLEDERDDFNREFINDCSSRLEFRIAFATLNTIGEIILSQEQGSIAFFKTSIEKEGH